MPDLPRSLAGHLLGAAYERDEFIGAQPQELDQVGATLGAGHRAIEFRRGHPDFGDGCRLKLMLQGGEMDPHGRDDVTDVMQNPARDLGNSGTKA